MGDQQDFFAFFNTTLPALFRALLVVTADRELATDAAAEALSRAWEKWPELHNPRAWVWQVAYNHVRTWWRRIGTHEVLTGAFDEEVELTAGAFAAAAPAAAEVDLDLLKAIADLPAQQRAVVAGRYLVGLRPREVARALGIDRRTESEHHRRAMMTLRQRLAGWGTPMRSDRQLSARLRRAFEAEPPPALSILDIRKRAATAQPRGRELGVGTGGLPLRVWSRQSRRRRGWRRPPTQATGWSDSDANWSRSTAGLPRWASTWVRPSSPHPPSSTSQRRPSR